MKADSEKYRWNPPVNSKSSQNTCLFLSQYFKRAQTYRIMIHANVVKSCQESIFVWKQCLGQTAGHKVEILKQRTRSMKDLCALEDIKMSCHDGAHIESWVIIYCNLLHFMERSISRWRHDDALLHWCEIIYDQESRNTEQASERAGKIYLTAH